MRTSAPRIRKPNQKAFPMALAAFVFLGVTLLANSASAHPFHVTLAEAELNPKTGMLEVALWVNPVDLEQALSQRTGKRIDIEKTAKVDKMIEGYLRKKVQVFGPDGKARVLEWVGKQVTLKETWLYFQFPYKGSLKGAKVSNTLFLDTVPKQVNTFNLREGKLRGTVNCTRREPKGRVLLKEPKKKKPAPKKAPKTKPPG